MDIILNDSEKAKAELRHVGVLGMRWGHRKNPYPTSTSSRMLRTRQGVDNRTGKQISLVSQPLTGLRISKKAKDRAKRFMEQEKLISIGKITPIMLTKGQRVLVGVIGAMTVVEAIALLSNH